MAVKQNKENEKSRLREIAGLILVCLAVFLIVALISYDPADWPNSSRAFKSSYFNRTGWIGAMLSYGMILSLGYTSYAVVIFLLVAGVVVFLHKEYDLLVKPAVLLGSFGLFIPVILGLFMASGVKSAIPYLAFGYGGVIGGIVADLLETYLGIAGAYIFSTAVILVSVVLSTDLKPSTMVEWLIKKIQSLFGAMFGALSGKNKENPKKSQQSKIKDAGSAKTIKIPEDGQPAEDPFVSPVGDEEETVTRKSSVPPMINYSSALNGDVKTAKDAGRKIEDEYDYTEEEPVESNSTKDEYILPTSNIFDEPPENVPQESREEMIEKANEIVESLRHFNIDAEVRQITPGPIVTRYELTLAPGVKVGRVVNLSDDLALALKSKGGIRILAPIPGKAAIGIEVPNKSRAVVYYREIIESEPFTGTDNPLALAIGKNTAGEPAVADLAKMPHMLIAGSTGSGKSVCINTIIASILMKATPYKVRMMMIDPKVVELNIYNKIPHLLTPVITDPKKASESLKWAVREMETRYRLLASVGVRDLEHFNSKVASMKDGTEKHGEIPEPLPYIVIIIDEFADLMVVASNEIEESIARLAQMARAVGIHLVLATQRPSADVITGLIKANFPSRIAFKVMQAANSRIILDQNGADKLLGMGDMLFLQSARPEPIRLHGAFVSSEESSRLVEYVASQRVEGLYDATDEMFRDEPEEEDNTLGMRDPNARDALFFRAAYLVARSNQGSVSLLQRRLKIGYARAARLIDQLELAGIVSPYDGSKAREVRVDESYIAEMEREGL